MHIEILYSILEIEYQGLISENMFHQNTFL